MLTCVGGAVDLHRHINAGSSIGWDVQRQILLSFCGMKRKNSDKLTLWKVWHVLNFRGNSPCPLFSLRPIGLKWEAMARRFCWRACCMRRCCSSASCFIFFSGPLAAAEAPPAAPRSSLSFRCSNVAACASCCCCPRARAMGSRLGSTGVDTSSKNKTGKKEEKTSD